MSNWPTWYEGKELSAQDMFQLERFLLERAALPGEGTGIERLDLATSLRVSIEGSMLEVRCKDVQGVATAGHSVCLKEELVARLPKGEIREETFHAWIEVNPPEEAEAGHKFRLLVSSSELPAGDRLHLGQFRFDRASLAFVSRPKVRHFLALQPCDKAWQAWVQPLLGAMQKRQADLEARKPPFTLATIAYATDLCRLVGEWARLPVSDLFRRIQLIRLLGDRTKLTDDVGPTYWPRFEYPFTELAKADEWPQLLADELTPKGEEPPAPVEDVGFGTLVGAHQAILGLRPQDQSVLAEMLVDMTGRSIYLLVALDCRPPLEIEFMIVSRGKDEKTTVVAAGLLQGTVRGSHMTYLITPTPQPGQKVRFRPFQSLSNADKVKMTFVTETAGVAG